MSHIFVIDRVGETHRLEARPGFKVMEIIRDAGLPIEASCGGNCACATCHCYIDEAWMAELNPPDEEEIDMLDMAFDVTSASRLTCQIYFTEALEGLRLTIAPD